jgi:hypothetical protein
MVVGDGEKMPCALVQPDYAFAKLWAERKHGNWEKIVSGIKKHALSREPGIDGILVTVGLCIIALLLCVVMKDSLTTFIQTIVTAMQTKAADILTGV